MRLIDADALKKAFKRSPFVNEVHLYYARQLINLAPTVKEIPHGKWITTPNPNYSPFDSTSEVIYRCSQCGYSNGERVAEIWNFCPNCGALICGKKVKRNDS